MEITDVEKFVNMCYVHSFRHHTTPHHTTDRQTDRQTDRNAISTSCITDFKIYHTEPKLLFENVRR